MYFWWEYRHVLAVFCFRADLPTASGLSTVAKVCIKVPPPLQRVGRFLWISGPSLRRKFADEGVKLYKQANSASTGVSIVWSVWPKVSRGYFHKLFF